MFMTIDPKLLELSRAAAAQLAEADRRALLARGEYHTAIRRLHLAGASLREIAEALQLSHQRVKQIVDAAGGTWWQRIWRTREPKRDAVCTFCGRPPSEVAKLVAGPNVYACDRCVAQAKKVLGGGSSAAFHVAAKGRCSFCGKPRAAERPVVSSAAGSFCGECLKIADEIIEGRARA